MIEPVRQFIFRLLILALILTCIGYGLFSFIFPQWYFPMFPVLPAFLLIITVAVHIYLVRASRGDVRKLITKYLVATGLKILIYLCFIIIFLVINPAQAVPFLISFLVMYFAFTVFEVLAILPVVKNRK